MINRKMKKQAYKQSLICLLMFAGIISSYARVELPKIFTDNMVLQQQTEAPIWGKASPNKEIKIIPSWDNQTYTTTADNAGKWSVKIKTPQAGGPYTISISDGKAIKLNNVLIGEVWICSGQSNMEMPLAGWGKVHDFEKEIAAAGYPQIRLFHVDQAISPQPLEDLKSTRNGWEVCTPTTIAEFSSVAYFFGRNLNENLNVPIGLISTSWGGTIAEAWTSGESLNYMPDFQEAVEIISNISEKEEQALYEQKFKVWNEAIMSADNGFNNNWMNVKMDDSSWNEMSLPGEWEKQGLEGFDGIVWFRKTIEIPSGWAGKELELNVAMIDDNDITYFNGEKVGETNGHNINRLYKIPAKLAKSGKAVITVRVTDTGGGGGIYGEAESLSLRLSSKKGEQKLSLAGQWKYQPGVDLSKHPKTPQSFNSPNQPTVLYNAMIHPLVPYSIQGAIWYQGESNVSRGDQYKILFPLMIQDWRKAWKNNFPFYFVQLANFMEEKPKPESSDWAKLREAQLQTLNLDNTGMVVAIDIGEAEDIHPKNKQDIGLRLALNARANTYSEKIAFSGPIYKSYTIKGNKIRISFSNTNNGLKIKEGLTLKGFAIAGPDQVFHWADASIDGNDVIVSTANVKFPVAVRYAWADNPVCNLYNGDDLPASPFRTDEW